MTRGAQNVSAFRTRVAVGVTKIRNIIITMKTSHKIKDEIDLESNPGLRRGHWAPDGGSGSENPARDSNRSRRRGGACPKSRPVPTSSQLPGALLNFRDLTPGATPGHKSKCYFTAECTCKVDSHPGKMPKDFGYGALCHLNNWNMYRDKVR
jgi:hypothetical protein